MGGNYCHCGRFGIELLLEENGQVRFSYVAEDDFVWYSASITASHLVLYNLAMERTMAKQKREQLKAEFKQALTEFVETFKGHISTPDDQWTVKGFVDVFRNIYTISADTKIVSKILEIHLFPQLLEFANQNNYRIVLAEQQNYYPDLSFVNADDESIKFAVDLKTTYRLPDNPEFCNGFTLGSHGEYFTNRKSNKNIQFPYNEYLDISALVLFTRALDQSKLTKQGPIGWKN